MEIINRPKLKGYHLSMKEKNSSLFAIPILTDGKRTQNIFSFSNRDGLILSVLMPIPVIIGSIDISKTT